jgi:hypothetical protein
VDAKPPEKKVAETLAIEKPTPRGNLDPAPEGPK